MIQPNSRPRPARRRSIAGGARLLWAAACIAAIAITSPSRLAHAEEPAAAAVPAEAAAVAPITDNPSSAARALLTQFYRRGNLTTDRVAIGQQLRTSEYGPKSDPAAWYGDWLQFGQQGLSLPEIMGGELSDLMRYGDFFPNQAARNELIAHGRRGHVVTLVWHPANPVAGGDFSTPISTVDLTRMVNDATLTGKAWQTQLDRAAAALAPFQAANVPVLFRPLHEQNGTFFWWGHNGATGAALQARQAAWTKVWADMVAELTVRRGLKNLLFVFGTNQVNYAEVAPPLTYYPGDTLVDMTSIDVYDEQLDLAGSSRGLQYYQDLVGLGKPFGLSEFGQSFNGNGTGANAAAWDARTLARRLRDSYKRAVFATAWYSSREGSPPRDFTFALPDVAHTSELFADPLIDTQ